MIYARTSLKIVHIGEKVLQPEEIRKRSCMVVRIQFSPCVLLLTSARNPRSYEDKDLCRLFDPAIANGDPVNVSADPSTITACRWSWHHGSEGRNAEKLMGECMEDDKRTIVLKEGRGDMTV